MNQNAVPRLNNHFRLQWEAAQNAHVLLYPEGMVKLNQTAGLILSNVDGARTVSGLIDYLEAEYPEAESVAEDTLAFLQTAHEQRWIEFV